MDRKPNEKKHRPYVILLCTLAAVSAAVWFCTRGSAFGFPRARAVSSKAESAAQEPKPSSAPGPVGSAASSEPEAKLIKVPYLSQDGRLPTGCELVSAAMVLRYYGYDTSMDKISGLIPKVGLTRKNGRLFGPHPAEAFVGDPLSPGGYGCYAPVIEKAMNTLFRQSGTLEAVDETGSELVDLVARYIDHDAPVLIWATADMQKPGAGTSWTVESTGKEFRWISGEHCLVLIGYNSYYYFFNDPYAMNRHVGFRKDLVAARYAALGRQAVAVRRA